MFMFMKEFVVYPTCCSMTYEEKHVVESIQWQTTEYVWLTKIELYIMYKAYAFEEGKVYADKLIAASKKPKKHPQFPKDPGMFMYRVLKSLVEGKSMQRRQSSSLNAEGQVDGDAAKVLNTRLEAAAKRGLGSIGATSIEAPEGEGEPPKKVNKVRAQADPAKKVAKFQKKGKREKQIRRFTCNEGGALVIRHRCVCMCVSVCW